MGIANTFGSMPGFLSPNIAGILLDDSNSYDMATGWNYIFIIAGVFLALGGVFYGVFAQADVQSWAIDETKTDERLPLQEMPQRSK
jgi:MFS family permease